MNFQGLYLVQDDRSTALPTERIPPLVTVQPGRDPVRGDFLNLGYPNDDFPRKMELPDEDDNEVLNVSPTGDFAQYVTGGGTVTFRKVTLDDALELQLQFPEIEFPTFATDKELVEFLTDYFLPPA